MPELTGGEQTILVGAILLAALIILLVVAALQPKCRACGGKKWVYADHAVVAGRRVRRLCTDCEGTGVRLS